VVAGSWSISLSPANYPALAYNGAADGNKQFTVKATDTFGKITQLPFSMVEDATVPLVTIDQPQATDWLSGTSSTVVGSTSDVTSGISTVEIRIDANGDADFADGGVENYAPATGTLAWNSSINLAALGEGTRSLEVRVTDTAGNQANLARNFGVDLSDPTSSVTGPGSSNAAFSVTGTATDGNGLESISVSQAKDAGTSVLVFEDLALAGLSSPWSITNLPRDPLAGDPTLVSAELVDTGVYEYTIQVTDVAGRTYTVNETVNIDVDGPTLSVVNPAEGAVVLGSAYTINGTSADVGTSGVVTVEYSWDSPVIGLMATGTVSWNKSIDLVALGEGVHTLRLLPTDNAGNAGVTTTRNIVVDQSPPSITETTVGAGSVFRTAAFTIGGGAGETVDDTNELATLVVTQNGVEIENQDISASGTSAVLSITNLPRDPGTPAALLLADGVFNYIVTVIDVAGKTAEITRSVTVDLTVPSADISQVTPLVGSSTVNGTVTFTASATDANGLVGVKWDVLLPAAGTPSYAGAANSLVSAPYTDTIDTTLLSDSTAYKLWVVAQDRAGKETAVAFDLSVDQSSDNPVVSFTNMDSGFDTSPEASGNLQETGAKVTGAISDDDSVDASTILISVDAGAFGAVTQTGTDSTTVNFEHDLSALAEGEHYYSVQVDDVNGKRTTAGPVYFIVDKYAPSVATTSPAASSSHNAPFVLAGTASDANGLATFTINAISVTVAAGSWSYAVPELFDGTGDGAKSYTLTATDVFGKTTVVSFDFNVDATAPAAVISAPLVSDWLSGTTFTANGTGSDVTSVVDTIEIRVDTNGDADFNDLGAEDWAPASGTSNWSSVVSLAGIGEGTRTIEIRATDAAGNATTTSRSFGVDQSNPSTSVTAPANTNTTFSVTGTATDGNGLTGITVWQTKDAVGAVEVLNTALTGTSDGWSVPTMPNGGATTGVYEYTITVTDAAGKTFQDTATTTIDISAPTVVISNPGASDQLLGAAFSPTGTATDIGASGVATVEYRVDVDNDTVFSGTGFEAWTAATGTANWNTTLDFDTDGVGADTGLKEGEHELFVRATDGASNLGVDQSVIFFVDQAAPTLSETTVGTVSSSANSAFSLGGLATDSNELSSIVVTQSKDGASAVEVLNAALSGTSQAWSTGATLLPRDPGTPANALLATGEYTYVITLTDTANRISQLTRTVVVDTTAPVVSFTDPIPAIYDPALYGTGGYRVNGSVTLKGNATDNQSIATLTTQVGSETAQTETNKYSFSRTFDTTDTGAYGHTDLSSLVIEVVATDAAGNSTTAQYTVYVDQSSDAPTFELTNMDETVNASGAASTNLLEFNAAVIGTLSDDDSVDASAVMIQIDADGNDIYDAGEVFAAVSTPPGADGTQVTFRQDLSSLPEGTHKFKLQIDDIYGARKTTSDIYFVIDKSAPTIANLSPANGSAKRTDFNITGDISDTSGLKDLGGAGNVDIEWSDDGLAYTRVEASAAAPATAATFSIAISAASYPADGSQAFYVRATDIYGKTVVEQIEVLFDRVVPSISFTDPYPAIYDAALFAGAGGYRVNGSITLKGNATDDQTVATLTTQVGGQAIQNETNKYSFTRLFDTTAYGTYGHADNGALDVVVVATDAAGNSATETYTVWVDQSSDAPTFELTNMDETVTTSGAASTNLLEFNAAVIGTASDDDSVDASTVMIQIDADGNDIYDAGEVYALVSTPPGADGTQVTFRQDLSSLSEGTHKFNLQIDDINGTRTTTSDIYFVIDKSAPTIASILPANGSGANADFNITGDISDTSGLSDLGGAGNVDIEWSDDGLTYNRVEASAAAPATAATFSIPITAGDYTDGSQAFYVRATDIHGKTNVEQIEVLIDRVAPSVTFTDPFPAIFVANLFGAGQDGYEVNGSITLKGNATDDQTVVTLTTQVGSQAAQNETNKYSFTRTFDTTAYATYGHTDLSSLVIEVVATDGAGNSTTETYTVRVDQSTDAPTFELTNMDETVNTLGAASTNLLEFNAAVIGTLSDDDSVDASAVMIKIDADGNDIYDAGEVYALVSTPPGADGTQVSFRQDLSSLPEGTHKFNLRIDDINGTRTTTSDIYFVIDKSAPTIANLLPTNGSAKRTDFNITGDISDTSGLKDLGGAGNVDIEWSDDGLTYTRVDASAAAPATAATFSIAISAASYPADGSQAFYVRATDIYGKTVVEQIEVLFDRVVPSISFTDPYPAIYDAALFAGAGGYRVNGSITLKGNATDDQTVATLTTQVGGQAIQNETNKYSFTRLFDTTAYGTYGHGDNGALDVVVVATDAAGNSTTETYTVWVDQSSDNPTFDLTNMDETVTTSGAASTNLLEFNAAVIGSASDDDSVDASALMIQIDADGNDIYDAGEVYALVSTPPGADGTQATFRQDLSSLPEGTHKFNLQIDDINGTRTTTSDIYFVIDKSAPTIANILPANGSGVNADFNITGNISDTSGLADLGGAGNVDIEWSDDGLAYTRVDAVAAAPATATTFSIPITAATYGEGSQAFYIRVTDIYGKTVVAQIQILIDTAPPSVSYTYPAAGSSLNGLATIRGTSSDSNQVTDVEYSLDGGTGWTSVSSDKYSWNFSFDTRGLTQGAFTLKIRATDSAANVSAVQDLALTLDQVSDYPVVDLINMDEGITTAGAASGNLLESNAKVQGTITDDDWLDATTVQISIDGGAFVAVGTVGSSSPSVSFEHPLAALSDGVHYITLQAFDTDDGANARKGGLPAVSTTSANIYFALDKTSPVMVITPPANTYTSGPATTMTGTVADGNDVASVLVSTDGGTTFAATGVTFTPGVGSPTRAWSWTGDLSAKPEGSFTLKAKGVDEFGKESIADLVITIDKTAPVMSFNTPSAGATVNQGVTISGTGAETYEFTLVEIALDSDGNGTFLDANDSDWATATGTYVWSYSLDSTTKADLTYDIHVRGTDAAGNVTGTPPVRVMTIDQSSDNPTFDLTNIDETVTTLGAASTNLLEFNAAVIGTASDDDSVESTAVMIQIDTDGNDIYDAGEVYALVSAPPLSDGTLVNFTQDLSSLSEGTHKFNLQIDDINGTRTTTSDIYFVIDKSAPAIANLLPANGSGANGDFNITGDISDTSGLADLGGAATVDIEWSDDGLTYNQVEASAGAPATAANFTIPITAATYGEGSQAFYIRATDIYGKTVVEQIQILIDTAPPTLTYTYPAAGSSLNGLATIRGTSSDTNQVTDVEYSLDGGTGWTAVASDKYSWNFSFDTTILTQGAFTLKIRATDSAANVSTVQDLALTLDQTSDYPVVDLINMDEGITTALAASGNLLESNAKVQGTITDDDWLDATTVQISINGGAFVAVGTVGSSSPSVSFEHSLAALADGVHYITLKAFDTDDGANARKGGLAAVSTTSADIYFALDKTSPVMVITPPASTYTAGPATAMSGTVGDGNDVDSVLVSTDGGTTFAATGVTFTAGAGSPARAWSWSGDLSAKPEGTFTLKAKGVDEFSKESISDLVITIDKTAPVMTFNTPSAGATVNQGVTISGTGVETYGFTLVEIALDSDGNGTFLAANDTDWTAATGTHVWSYSLDSTAEADLTYDIHVRGTDGAGNVTGTPPTRVMIIDQSSDNPTFVLTNIDESVNVIGNASTNLLEFSAAVIGTASDDDSVDASAVMIQIDADGNDIYDAGEVYTAVSAPGGDGTLVNFSQDLSSLSEGTHKFNLQIDDINGTRTTTSDIYFVIDKSAPTIANILPANGSGANADFNITGDISDTSGLKDLGGADTDIDVEWGIDGTSYALVDTNVAGGSSTASFSIPITAATYGEGSQAFYIRVTDIYDKTVVAQIQILIDTVGPTVSYTYPAASSSLNGLATIRGTSSDTNQVTDVEYSLDGGTGWTSVASDKYSWNFSFDTTILTQGAFTLKVRATDSAANVSADENLALTLDQTSDYPVVDLINMDEGITTSGAASGNLLESNAKVQGTFTDDDWLDAATVEIGIDGGAFAAVDTVGSSSPSVSFEHSLAALADGVHYITLKAFDTDDGGNARKGGLAAVSTTSATIYFALDKTSPVMVITPPASTYTAGPATAMSGTVGDGNDVDSVLVSTDGGTTFAATGVTFTAGAGSPARAWSWTGDLSAKPEGTFTLKVKGIDEFNKESIADLVVTIDKTAPVMTFNTPSAGATVNQTVAISGTGVETYGFTLVEIALDSDGNGTFLDANDTDWTAATGTHVWSYSLDSTAEANTTYDIHVRGTDGAGNVTGTPPVRVMTILQSSDNPTFALSNMNATVNTIGAASTNLLEFNAAVIGTASDDDSVESTAVMIQIDVDGNDAYDGGEVYALVSAPPAADGTLVNFTQDLSSLSEGTHKFNLQIDDINGTQTTTSDIYFVIDKSAPAIANILPANGSGVNGDFNITGDISDTSGLKDLGGAGTVDIEWSDNGTGYSPVEADTAAPTTTASFTIPITAATYGQGSQAFYIRATDIYGKTIVEQIQILIDTVGPTVSYTYPAASSSLNGLATVRGTSSDANQVTDVEYSLDGGTGWTSVASDKYSWNFSFDTTILTQGPFTLKVRATDSAANVSADEDLALTLDQTSDYPVVDLINMDKGITTSGAASGNLLESNAKVQGTFTDDDWLDAATVEIGIDGGAFAAVDTVGSSSPSVSFEHSLAALADGVHYITLKAFDTDDGGNARKGGLAAVSTTSATIYFALDKTSPVMVITPPASTYTAGPATAVSGTVGDGNDVTDVLVSTDGGTTFAATGVTFTAGAGSPARAWSWAGDLSAKPEGTFTVKAKGVDEFGKESIADLVITIDKTAPAMTFNTPSAGATVNQGVTISGTGVETYGFTLVEIALDSDGNGTFLDANDTDWTAATGTHVWSYSLDSTAEADLTYDIHVRGTDAAGNVTGTPPVRVITIDQSSDNPTYELTNMDESVNLLANASTNLLEFNAVAIGTASDDDSVDASTVMVQIDVDGDNAYGSTYNLNGDADTDDPYENEAVFWAVSTPPGSDGTQVTFRQDLSSLPEGTHKFRLQFDDTNGLQTTTSDIYFVIDKSAPTIASISPANGSGANADFNITGNISDTSGLKDIAGDTDVDIEWGTDGISYAVVDTDVAGGSSSAAFTIPITVATYGQGTQAFYIRASDIYGKTVVAQIQILIDTVGPTVSYTYPAAASSLNGLATVRGTSSDANQVTDVEYSLDGGTGWTSVSSDKYSWNFSFDTTILTQGAFTLKVKATDSSSNVSTVQDLALTLDQASDYPVVDLINMDEGITTALAASGNLLESNAKVQGTITDDDWLDAATVEIAINGGAYAAVGTVGTSSTSVSFEHSLAALADGVHYITIKASDTDDGANARKGGLAPVVTTTDTIYFTLDKTNPVVVITPPATTFTTGPFTMSGTVGDGSDVDSVLVSTDGGTTFAATGVTFTPGAGSPALAWSWTGDLSAKPEGPFTLKVKGVDEFSKESVADLVITVDKTGPTMGFSAPLPAATVNGPVTISGTGVETYGLASVEIALDGDRDGAPFDGANDTDWTTVTGTYAWTYTFDTATEADLTYDIYVRGTDGAGNITAVPPSQVMTIDQSTDAPGISLSTVTLAGTYADNLLPGSLQISGTASDDDSVENTSLQIRIDVDDNGDFAGGGLENWAAISGQPGIDSNVATWSHDFSVAGLADGIYRFEMRVGDINFAANYGDANKATTIGPVLFSVDTALPTGTITGPAQGAYLNDPGTGKIVISGTAADASGIQKVEIDVNGGGAVAATGTTAWSYDYTIGADGQVTYQIIITDNYNKVFTIDRYFTVDDTAPTLAYTQPAAAETVNGSMVVRGTTTEANQVAAVYLWLGADGAAVPGDPSTGDFTGWTTLGGTFSWTERINTTLSADAVYDVHVHAVDNAGNISADTILQDLDFDQTTNLPVVGASNLVASPTVNLFGTGGTITGSISDDDTVDASTIEISFDDGTTWGAVTSPGSDSTSVSWAHDLSGQAESGTAYTVRIRASDIGDVANGVAVQTTTIGPFVVAVDRNNPAIAASELAYLDRYTAAPISVTGGAMSGALINNNFTLVSTTSDASGVAAVAVSTNGGAYLAATDNLDGTWDYTVAIDVAGNTDDGTFTFVIRSTDTWGRENTDSLAVVIDTTEPVVTYLEPAAAASVNGIVTVRGTTFDGGVLNTITMEGGIVSGSSPVTLTNTGTISSWLTTFDATLYDNATYATWNGSTWDFPLAVIVNDTAGNKTTELRTVKLDRDGDKPIVVDATLVPADGSSVAGTIVLQSSVTDDDAPAFVRIYADLNDDGDYADDYAFDLSSPADADTTDPFETEGAYLQVAVTNGVWSTLVNENSEFGITNMTARGVAAPTGDMRFAVVAYDSNGLAGDAVWRSVYIDASSPEILNLSYSNGALVKGSINLTGDIRDDAALAANRIKISLDGGVTYADLTVVGPTIGGGFYNYTFDEAIDTTSYYNDASGNLGVALRVTDETFKQSNVSLTLNVDNARPGVLFNDPATLPYTGTPPNELYSFYGDNDTPGSQNQLIGSATDSGVVSGIEKVNVYFVKSGFFESPKNGFAPVAVSNSLVYNQGGTQDSIPFTEDGDYVITINNRLEQGQFDQTVDIGDFDGFEESLRAKVGYDEWYAFFDTTELPDGPMDVYYIAYDDAGNTSYGKKSAQSANFPPTVDSVNVGANTIDDGTNSAKISGAAVSYVINASDAGSNAGISVAAVKLYVTNKYQVGGGGSIGTEDLGFTPFYYGSGGVAAFTTTPVSGTGTPATATVVIDTTNATYYESGYWFLYQAEVTDADGNIATRDFYVWVNNTDSAAPVVTINDFSQSSVNGSGHVEEGVNSPHSDSEADISGTVEATGTIYDDTSVSSLVIEASYDGGTSYTDIGTVNSFGAPVSGDALTGFTYNWTYSWDTSTVAGGARNDVILRVRGFDGTNTTLVGSRPSKTVDVVPYITDLQTGLDSGLLAYGKRSATGRYPVSVGDTIFINGYNLPGTAASSVSIGGTALTPAAGSNSTTLEIALGVTTTSGQIIVTTNSTVSLNDQNTNGLPQNQEDNLFNTNLTDDRYVDFWDLRSHTSLANMDDAYMGSNAAGDGVDWLYVEFGNYLKYTDGALNGNAYMTDGFGIAGGDFAYNDDGTILWHYLHNATWTAQTAWGWYGSVQWGRGVIGTRVVKETEAYNWHVPLRSRLSLGNMSFIGDANFGYGDAQLNRYKDLRLVVTGDDAITNNHVAYRDVSTSARALVFYGFQTGTDAGITGTVLDNGWDANLSMTANITAPYKDTGNDGQKEVGVQTPPDRRGTITTDNASYYDLVVTSAGVAVAAWFDIATSELKLAYNAAPMTDATTWTERTNPIATSAGAHVALAADPDGGIHLAYLDAATAYMKYTYLPAHDTADVNIETVTVDAMFSSGQQNSIAIRDFGTNEYRPVISTYSTTYSGTKGAVRVAWPTTTLAGLSDGASASTSQYTGDWEVMFVPASVTPGTSKTFIEVINAATTNEVTIGYNGTNLEEASYLGNFGQ
jgi:large repetitive protein